VILIIDNYDSFTYNLAQLVGRLKKECKVVRNDAVTVEEIRGLRPEGIILSPGPGRPESAGICVALIRDTAMPVPILGVCLGHQAIGHAFGAPILHAPSLVHGKTSEIYHDGETIFRGLPLPFHAARYHSLVIGQIPAELEVTAQTSGGVIMGVRHKHRSLHGIQFHPESILTEFGGQILSNWFAVAGMRP
jgi:anthranilate synthase/aminodeoxychorismate synthase-like glutamine amidotransferase